MPGGVSLGHWHLGLRSKYGHGAPLSQSEWCERDCRQAAYERGPGLNGRRRRERKERRAEDKCGGSAGKGGGFWLSGRALSGALDFDRSLWRLVLRAVSSSTCSGLCSSRRWRLVLRTASRRWPGSLVSAKPHEMDRSMSFWVSACVCLSVGPSLSSKLLSAFAVHYLPCISY